MSVFRTNNTNSSPSRDPYPINRSSAKEEGIPDGPTERIAEPPARKTRPRVLLAVVALAVVALLVAGTAVLVAWWATALARDARAPQPVAGVPAGAPAPRGGFAVSYAQEPLRVQVGCSAVLFVDLDEPRANAGEQVSDLRYDSRCGDQPPRLTLGPGAAGGSQVPGTDTDAAGCDRAIRTSPLGPGANVEVRKGVVLCVLTAGRPAEMVLVEITDVGTTGTAGMRATSWQVAG
jgi:hypothetical protein